jgi:hypothetical protein
MKYDFRLPVLRACTMWWMIIGRETKMYYASLLLTSYKMQSVVFPQRQLSIGEITYVIF